MFEIGNDELRVMNCLVHAEELASVIIETGLPEKVVIDIVRHLVHYRYVKPVNESGRELGMFEVDKIRKVMFLLSAKGYKELEKT